MGFDDIEVSPEEVAERLRALFDAAKAKDEFEFGCSLLRVRGMESPGWDPLMETTKLVDDLTALISSPLRGHTKVRLGLLLYSHLTEVEAIYSVLGNLCRVTHGDRYVVDPFLDATPRNKKGEVLFLSTPAMVRALREMLDEAGFVNVSELFDWFFVPALRNSFSHADYILYEDKFRSRSDNFSVGSILTPELDLDLVADILNRALGFFGLFMEEYDRQRRAFSENKVVPGRIAGDDPVDVEVLADEKQGLYGFRSPPSED